MSIWGKIIGGTAGFALGGPLGAILGMMAGNVFDKSKSKSFNFHGTSISGIVFHRNTAVVISSVIELIKGQGIVSSCCRCMCRDAGTPKADGSVFTG